MNCLNSRVISPLEDYSECVKGIAAAAEYGIGFTHVETEIRTVALRLNQETRKTLISQSPDLSESQRQVTKYIRKS